MKRRVMRRWLLAAPVVLFCGLLAQSTRAESARDAWAKLVSGRSQKHPAFAFVENNPELPNVLIYGDSISIAYTQRVRTDLKGKANVYRVYCNGGDSSSFVQKMTRMHEVMRDKKLDEPWGFQWDVIHFNVGLHDLKYVANGKLDKKNGKQVSSIDDYKKNLRGIVAHLKTEHPAAKLIFCTTTPVPENSSGRVAGDAAKYNAAALEVLRRYPEIAINDLYAFTKPNHEKWMTRPGNVHFNKAGSDAQGSEVAKGIEAVLPGEKGDGQEP